MLMKANMADSKLTDVIHILNDRNVSTFVTDEKWESLFHLILTIWKLDLWSNLA